MRLYELALACQLTMSEWGGLKRNVHWSFGLCWLDSGWICTCCPFVPVHNPQHTIAYVWFWYILEATRTQTLPLSLLAIAALSRICWLLVDRSCRWVCSCLQSCVAMVQVNVHIPSSYFQWIPCFHISSCRAKASPRTQIVNCEMRALERAAPLFQVLGLEPIGSKGDLPNCQLDKIIYMLNTPC